MERFIVVSATYSTSQSQYLKSSMERFIAASTSSFVNCVTIFKIQYGEIYSHTLNSVLYSLLHYLKSSMERFIVLSMIFITNSSNNLKSSMERFIVICYFKMTAQKII